MCGPSTGTLAPLRAPGGTPWNFWWGYAARLSKSRPNFRPKNAIFHTRFQTWPQKSIPVFRPDLENIHPFSDMALETRPGCWEEK